MAKRTSAASPTGHGASVIRAKRLRLSEHVADEIKNLLIAEGLQPGDRLPTEPELVEMYDVSRTVIREAGRLLVERGLVDIRPGRGMVVAAFDGKNISRQYELMLEVKQGTFEHLMEMRLVLEVGMTEYAALRRTPADLEQIHDALDSFDESETEHASALEADLAFHESIAVASRNPFFIHVVNPINDYLRRAYRSSLGYEAARSDTLAEHTRIAEAIESRDPTSARRAAREHLERIAADSGKLVADMGDTVDD